MELRGTCLLFGVLLLVNSSLQQSSSRRKPSKKDVAKDSAITEMQKQIDNIIQELNLLKERQALQTVCLKGAKIHGKCYLADPVKKRYHAANEDCNAMGGVLGAPTSDDENNQLREYIHQSLGPDERVWLGINDMMTEDSWKDPNGFSVVFKNWDTSDRQSPQPDGGMSQNCVVLSGASAGKWSDERCSDENASVCQFNIV